MVVVIATIAIAIAIAMRTAVVDSLLL